MKIYTLLLVWTNIALNSGNVIPYKLSIQGLLSGGKTITQDEQQIFLEESFLTPQPQTIFFDDNDTDADAAADDRVGENFVGREIFNLSEPMRDGYFNKVGRLLIDEHAVFSIHGNPGRSRVDPSEWSEWTCCRRIVNIQSRERIQPGRKIDMQYMPCGINYCRRSMCRENSMICSGIMATINGNLCDPKHPMSSFMSHHCPNTCKFCVPSQDPPSPNRRLLMPTPKRERNIITTLKPTTTKAPKQPFRPPLKPSYMPQNRRPLNSNPTPYEPRTPQGAQEYPNRPRPLGGTQKNQDAKVVKITILKHNINPSIPSYKFIIGDTVNIRSPWSRVNPPKLSSFRLYTRPTAIFKMPISFCSSKDSFGIEKWSVTKDKCKPGWNHKQTLYGSARRAKSAELYFVGTSKHRFGTSEISKTLPSSQYRAALFVFYGPQYAQMNDRPTLPTYTTRRNYPTPRTPKAPSSMNHRSSNLMGGINLSPRNEFNKECLEAHNFFRAIHNVPPLRWSDKLATSAQKWADQLKYIAPRRPSDIEKPHLKTFNWPHSVAGSEFRERNTGENIAWDLSQDGSPARESILRFYVELFYYNRKHPTYSPSRDRPVGHLTQLLWKDTTHVGCAKSISRVGVFQTLSTWTVVHYSPGGNQRYRSSVKRTVELYDAQVPDMRSGSCMTRYGSCRTGNQCMAFGPTRGKCSCTRGSPVCSSPKGCIAWCVNKRGFMPWREECEGKNECKCTTAGAVCR